MSRIVFTNQLRKTINAKGDQAPFYARPRVWIVLALLNAALFTAVAMSWKIDSLWSVLPAAKAYPVASSSAAAAVGSPLQGKALSTAVIVSQAIADAYKAAPEAYKAAPEAYKAAPEAYKVTPLDPKAQRAAQYIASTYHIAKEASELIVREAFKAGKENHVDPLLVLAIIAVESRFNPISESEAGALGLTQAMPESHPEKVALLQKDRGHILNIADNIKLGTKIIGEYMRKFENNPVLALQQYNGSLQDHSRAYSKHVLELRAKMGRAVG